MLKGGLHPLLIGRRLARPVGVAYSDRETAGRLGAEATEKPHLMVPEPFPKFDP